MTKLFSIKGKVQDYAWGGFDFIPNLLEFESTSKPAAEYWLGAHSKAPSSIETDYEIKPLDEFLDENKTKYLGEEITEKFGRLPFLFKVLDVKEMLSIQVHPTKIEAEKGFLRENEEEIPLTAKHRNYKDDNHKPEIMVALSEFWLLHGFLTENKLLQVLKTIPEFQFLTSVFEEEGYFSLYKTVMEFSQEECNHILQPLVDRILPLYEANKLEKSNPDYWAAKAVATSDDKTKLDRGIFSIYFFNIVRVDRGEAVFQDAGIPHAYLEGQNMELMANSDNVLRGGLTPKHVDVPELLKHVAFEETIPNIMQGELQSDGLERIYRTPAPDFQLSKIDVNSGDIYTSTSKTAEIIIALDGTARISEGDKTLEIKRGETAFLLANSKYFISTNSMAELYKATAPF